MQIGTSGGNGPDRGTSLAEAGLNGRLDFSVLVNQHAHMIGGLAVCETLTSHLPRAGRISHTNNYSLDCGDADGGAIGSTQRLQGFQELLKTLC